MSFTSAIRNILNLGGAAAAEAAESADSYVAALFPKTYSLGAEKQLLEEKDAWSQKFQAAKTRLQAKKDAAEAIKTRISTLERLLATSHSKAAWETAVGDAKASLFKQAGDMREDLDARKKKLAKEEQQVELAQANHDRIQEIYTKFSEELRGFKAKAKEMQERLEDAQTQAEQAQIELNEAASTDSTAVLASISKASSGLESAVVKAEENAARLQREAQEERGNRHSSVDEIIARAEANAEPKRADPWS